jgi:hydrogenase maturation protease
LLRHAGSIFRAIHTLAAFRGWSPEKVVLIGVQPEVLEDYGGSLSDTVKARLPEAVQIAVNLLESWQAGPVRRTEPSDATERITLDSLDLPAYEGERPSATQACRVGDARFLPAGAL